MSRLSFQVGCLFISLIIFCFFLFLLQEMDLRLYENGILLPQWKNVWIVQFLLNLLGYSSIFIPGLLIYKFVHKTDYLQKAGNGCLPSVLRSCIVGSSSDSRSEIQQQQQHADERKNQTFFQKLIKISFCVSGLLDSYLLWGLLQERIMAVKYGAVDGESEGENFKNSLFLEFMNRILALIVAAFVLLVSSHPPHRAPLYKYSFNSISNVMSSWCQYEALKYVSFPVQVLAKASKVIPVMLMGKLVSKRTFTWTEYATAGSLSVGLFLFLVSNGDGSKLSGRTLTISGIILLCGYLLFDSFTSNWQGELFRTYRMSSVQMMAGSNLFSVLFAGVSLLEQGGFLEAIRFMSRHPLFISHIGLLSLTSTSGQLFIFYTINHFGPVTFTIIMTVRQALSILLSCIYYGHPVRLLGLFGLTLFFSSIFARVYFGHMQKKHAKSKAQVALKEVVVATTDSGKSQLGPPAGHK